MTTSLTPGDEGHPVESCSDEELLTRSGLSASHGHGKYNQSPAFFLSRRPSFLNGTDYPLPYHGNSRSPDIFSIQWSFLAVHNNLVHSPIIHY